jgi:hypothetical protein
MEHIEDIEAQPYEDQATDDLLYLLAVLRQEDIAVPVDLVAVLIDRGCVLVD